MQGNVKLGLHTNTYAGYIEMKNRGGSREKTISVVITIYNVENYMDACIESVVNQTYKNLEIILVNDGSLDESGNKCEEWQAKDSRIRVIHKKNGGTVSARKAGVQSASGEYIGYVDGDDWIDLDMFERMADLGFRENVDIVSVENIREYADGRQQIEPIRLEEGIYRDEEYNLKVLKNLLDVEHFFQWNIPMHGWQHLYKRDLLLKNQMLIDNGIRRGEDMLVAVSCYIDAESVALLKRPFYHYRQLVRSARGSAASDNLEGLVRLNERLKKICEENRYRRTWVRQITWQAMFYTLLWSAYEFCLSDNDSILFPFYVPRNSRIALIGAGALGTRMYHRIRELAFCDIVVWADNAWAGYQEKGLPVQRLDKLKEYEFDYAVVGTLNVQAQKQLVREAKSKGVEADRIMTVRQEMLSEEKLNEIMERLR